MPISDRDYFRERFKKHKREDPPFKRVDHRSKDAIYEDNLELLRRLMKVKERPKESGRRLEERETSIRQDSYGIRYCPWCRKWFGPFRFGLHKFFKHGK